MRSQLYALTLPPTSLAFLFVAQSPHASRLFVSSRGTNSDLTGAPPTPPARFLPLLHNVGFKINLVDTLSNVANAASCRNPLNLVCYYGLALGYGTHKNLYL